MNQNIFIEENPREILSRDDTAEDEVVDTSDMHDVDECDITNKQWHININTITEVNQETCLQRKT